MSTAPRLETTPDRFGGDIRATRVSLIRPQHRSVEHGLACALAGRYRERRGRDGARLIGRRSGR